MNIHYHVITAAAHIKSLGEMRQEYGLTLTSSFFKQLYVNELDDSCTCLILNVNMGEI